MTPTATTSTIITINPDSPYDSSSKPSSKSRRSRRRRGQPEDSDLETGDGDSSSDRGSLTDESGTEDEDESEDEVEAKAPASVVKAAPIPAAKTAPKPKPVAKPAPAVTSAKPPLPKKTPIKPTPSAKPTLHKTAPTKSTSTSVFVDTTPMVWADQPPDANVEEVTFEEMSAGKALGKGEKAPREKKELTEEGRKKMVEKRERKKEKIKEKRKAEQAAKVLAKQSEKSDVGAKTVGKTEIAVVETEAAKDVAEKTEVAKGAEQSGEQKNAEKAEVATKAKPKRKAKGKGKADVAAVQQAVSESTLPIADDGGWSVDGPSRAVAAWAADALKPDDGGWGDASASSSTPKPNGTAHPKNNFSSTPVTVSQNGSARPPDPRPPIARPPTSQSTNLPYPRNSSNSSNFPTVHSPSNPNFPARPAYGMNGQQQFRPEFGYMGKGGYQGAPQPFRGNGASQPFRGRGRGYGPVYGQTPNHQQYGQSSISTQGQVQADDIRLEMEKVDDERLRTGNVQSADKAASSGSKWGHDAYERQVQLDNVKAAYAGMGRARGMARASMGRGGYAASRYAPPPQPLPTPARPVTDSHITQPPATVDELLPADTSGVTVHLPGSKESINVSLRLPTPSPTPPPAPSTQIRDAPPHTRNTLPPTAQTTIPTPPTHSGPTPLPLPLHLTGNSQQSHSPFTPRSETGSVSSSNFAPAPIPTFLPPGIAQMPNGDYYNVINGAPVDFHPTPRLQLPSGRGRGYGGPSGQTGRPINPFDNRYPSVPYANTPSPQMYYASTPPPMPQGYDNFRPDSPYDYGQNSYVAPQGMAYFAPPAPSKAVLIRDPSAPAGNESSDSATPTKPKPATPGNGYPYPPQETTYYNQTYNPYANAAPEMDMGEMQYGYGWQVPSGYRGY